MMLALYFPLKPSCVMPPARATLMRIHPEKQQGDKAAWRSSLEVPTFASPPPPSPSPSPPVAATLPFRKTPLPPAFVAIAEAQSSMWVAKMREAQSSTWAAKMREMMEEIAPVAVPMVETATMLVSQIKVTAAVADDVTRVRAKAEQVLLDTPFFLQAAAQLVQKDVSAMLTELWHDDATQQAAAIITEIPAKALASLQAQLHSVRITMDGYLSAFEPKVRAQHSEEADMAHSNSRDEIIVEPPSTEPAFEIQPPLAAAPVAAGDKVLNEVVARTGDVPALRDAEAAKSAWLAKTAPAWGPKAAAAKSFVVGGVSAEVEAARTAALMAAEREEQLRVALMDAKRKLAEAKAAAVAEADAKAETEAEAVAEAEVEANVDEEAVAEETRRSAQALAAAKSKALEGAKDLPAEGQAVTHGQLTSTSSTRLSSEVSGRVGSNAAAKAAARAAAKAAWLAKLDPTPAPANGVMKAATAPASRIHQVAPGDPGRARRVQEMYAAIQLKVGRERLGAVVPSSANPGVASDPVYDSMLLQLHGHVNHEAAAKAAWLAKLNEPQRQRVVAPAGSSYAEHMRRRETFGL